jgi:hypothetical protein
MSTSISYVTLSEEGELERASEEHEVLHTFLCLPSYNSAGWPPACVFVPVREAWRYLVTSVSIIVGTHS